MILIPAATAEPTVALGNPIATGRQHTQLWPPGKSSTPVFFQFSSFQFSRSVVSDSATPWTAARQASLSINNFQSLPKLMSIESVMPSNHLILCGPLLLLPSVFPNIRVFSSESVLHIRWPKYWSFSFSISPSNEHSGLISFRIHGLDLLAVQGTLKSLLQHHSSKASVLWCSTFFIVQLSHPYITTGKTIALTRLTFVDIHTTTMTQFHPFLWLSDSPLWVCTISSLSIHFGCSHVLAIVNSAASFWIMVFSEYVPRSGTEGSHGRSTHSFLSKTSTTLLWLPWGLRWWRICLQCKRPGFGPWVRKIPWRREWLPTLVFLPGESHGHF